MINTVSRVIKKFLKLFTNLNSQPSVGYSSSVSTSMSASLSPSTYISSKVKDKHVQINLIFSSIAIMVSIGVLIFVMHNKSKTVMLSTTNFDIMIVAVNQQREKHNVPELNRNSTLDKSATNKACDMKDKNYFAHISPEGKTPWQFFNEVNYNYTIAGENLAIGSLDNKEIIDAFMNSEKHRENILNPKFKDIGIGRCGLYLVQHFGTLLW